MEGSTSERTVTVLSKRDEGGQLILNTCNMVTEFGTFAFKDGRAENVPESAARRLLDSRADVEVYEPLGAPVGSAAAAAPATDGEIVEEPIREPPGRALVSPEEERERAKAAIEHLRSEGMEVPHDLLVAAGEAEPPPAEGGDVDLSPFALSDEERQEVLDLLDDHGDDEIRELAADLGQTTEGSIVGIAVNVIKEQEARARALAAAEGARAEAEKEKETGPPPPPESASQGGQEGAQTPDDDGDGQNGGSTDPDGSGAQGGSEDDEPSEPQHTKVVPEGLEARTGEGELRCLATKGDGSQCANVAVADSACGLVPHKKKVAQLPDAPTT